MSKIEFEAARQYIQAHDYDKAREVLEAMVDNPSAHKWLAKLDEISQPFPEIKTFSPSSGSLLKKEKRTSSLEDYTTSLEHALRQAQNVGRVTGIIVSVIGAGIVAFMLSTKPFLQTTEIPTQLGTMVYGPSQSAYLITAGIIGVGLILLSTGLYQIWYAGPKSKSF